MSVQLLNKKEIVKIANTLTQDMSKEGKESRSRDIWYAYISNITAYNLQYEEKTQIDFSDWNEDIKFETYAEAIDELGYLLYNVYTNAGNYFMPKESLDRLEKFYTRNRKIVDEVQPYNND
jgi:hypothetical protein